MSIVAEVKGKVRTYYERFPLFREKKKGKLTKKKNNINQFLNYCNSLGSSTGYNLFDLEVHLIHAAYEP